MIYRSMLDHVVNSPTVATIQGLPYFMKGEYVIGWVMQKRSNVVERNDHQTKI